MSTLGRICSSTLFLLVLSLVYPAAMAEEPYKQSDNPGQLFSLGGAAFIEGIRVVPPQNFAGTLWIMTGDGLTHHCTAMFVTSNVLLTAAHCVQLNGTTTQYILNQFIRNDKNPNGTAPTTFMINASCIKVPDLWATVTDPSLRIRFDYAFVQTTTALVGETIPNLNTGRISVGTLLTSIGYPVPGADPTIYNYDSVSSVAERDFVHPRIQMYKSFDTSFKDGVSGGPWILSDGSVGANNSSFFTPYDPSYLKIYGPILPSSAATLRNAAQNCH